MKVERDLEKLAFDVTRLGEYPSFIVSEMLGSTPSGSIGLWVDIGTEGYFKDFKFTQK
ncbi:hypothetical protein [uncultured Proteiniphilum sp.]|uniref:hypothetical protein n=1 Tax=uncultured Proteiniphilum sp. TaxID=497637 RepID=UPI0026163698|nr:hypothetical protein [uncultured Proteiniphilum sp.]